VRSAILIVSLSDEVRAAELTKEAQLEVTSATKATVSSPRESIEDKVTNCKLAKSEQ
jgi:hypothetical protein